LWLPQPFPKTKNNERTQKQPSQKPKFVPSVLIRGKFFLPPKQRTMNAPQKQPTPNPFRVEYRNPKNVVQPVLTGFIFQPSVLTGGEPNPKFVQFVKFVASLPQ
jgi:hypothetical protein